MKHIAFYLVPVLILPFCSLNAQPLTPDPSWGIQGIVLTGSGTAGELGASMAVQPDGKVLVCGTFGSNGVALLRCLPNGNPDPFFGINGKVVFIPAQGADASVECIGLQSNGKIVVAGRITNAGTGVDFFMARFSTSGAIDYSFGVAGVATTNFGGTRDDRAWAMVIQPDDKILLAGRTFAAGDNKLAVVRYKPNGVLDQNFGIGGKVLINSADHAAVLNAIALQTNGYVLAAGAQDNDFLLLRFDENGVPDNFFGNSGIVQTNVYAPYFESCRALAVLGNGKILAAGYSGDPVFRFSLVRYLANGAVDTTFGDKGKALLGIQGQSTTDLALTIQPLDGKIILGGSVIGVDEPYQVILARLLPSGQTDNSFNGNGLLTLAAGDALTGGPVVAVLPDGKVLYSGTVLSGADYDFVLMQCTENGLYDTGFSASGLRTYDFGWGRDADPKLLPVSDNKLLVAATGDQGYAQISTLTRLNAGGFSDSTFADDGKLLLNEGLQAVAVQPGEEIIVLRDNTSSNVSQATLERFFSDGDPDFAFGNNGMLEQPLGPNARLCKAVATQLDSKILVGGYLSRPQTQEDFSIARFLSTGASDAGFGQNGQLFFDFKKGNDRLICLYEQPDGRIMAAGTAWTGAGTQEDFALVRFKTNGAPDSTFGQNGAVMTDFSGKSDRLVTVVPFPDGRLLAVGNTFSTAGFNTPALSLYFANGVPDNSFGNNGKTLLTMGGNPNVTLNAALLLPDGKILTAGEYVGVQDRYYFLLRFTAKGAVDTTFADDGWFRTLPGAPFSFVNSLALTADDKILWGGSVFAGVNQEIVVARYRTGSAECLPVLLRAETGLMIDEAQIDILPSKNSPCPPAQLVAVCAPTDYCPCWEGVDTIRPSLNNYPSNGVTTFDLVLISRHILNISPLPSPYKIIAADINRSNSVTSFDIVELRKFILGIYQTFPVNKAWRFIDKSFVFPNPANPFAAPFPEYALAPANNLPLNVAFVAAKTGDLNDSHFAYCDSLLPPPADRAQQLRLEASPARAGEIWSADILCNAEVSMAAWQSGLRYDPQTLELLGIEWNGSHADHFDWFSAQAGAARALWFDPQGRETRFEAGASLLRLRFRALGDLPDPATAVQLDDAVLDNCFFNADGARQGLGMAGVSIPGFTLTALMTPNPAPGAAAFSVQSTAPGAGCLFLRDLSGRLLLERELEWHAGQRRFDLPEAKNWPTGCYAWQLTTATGRVLRGKWLRG